MPRDTGVRADCKPSAFTEQLKVCDLSFLERQKWRWRVNKDARLTPSAKLVLDCLVMHINCKYEECFPSQELMCAETALSENTVRSALQALRDCGWIEWRRATRKGSQTFYVYRMIWDANPQIEPVGTIFQGPPDPVETEGLKPRAAAVKPSTAGISNPQNLSPNSQREITNSSSLSTASPSRESDRSSNSHSPSAETRSNPHRQYSSPWWDWKLWNETGERFKAIFYPTVSKSAFKARLGELKRREGNDLRKLDAALLDTIKAEPGGDAWEYVSGVLRNWNMKNGRPLDELDEGYRHPMPKNDYIM